MEATTLAMAVLAPWAFAAVHPVTIFLLDLGLSAALVLWCALIIVERRSPIKFCPVLLCLLGMVALGLWQLAPLRQPLLETLSPATHSLRCELYPQQLESLSGEDDAVYPSPNAISLDPNATRAQVAQLVAVVALFAAVRFGIATPGSFRRFAVACAVNGALLSIVALAQRFSSPDNSIFWLYPAGNAAPFGPFVCRNNFPDYVNICLGLSIALLLTTPALRRFSGSFGAWLMEVAQSPTTLWLLLAVALMTAGVLFSMSRGGMIGLAAGAACCLALTVRARLVSSSLALAGLVAVLTLGVIGWFGADAVAQRMGSITDQEADGRRLQMWTRIVPLACHYPLWGTGYGTFMAVEPQTRQPGEDSKLDWENAHNDYLEMLVEGGVSQLLLALILIVLVFRNGIRALDRFRGRPESALAIGGLSGFTALLFHSFADFGLHIPAIVMLATLLIAFLSSLGDPVDRASPSIGRWMALPVVAASLTTALVLPIDAWFRERAEHYRLAAIRAGNRSPAGDRDTVIRYLKAAASYAPSDSLIRSQLADAEYEEYLARGGRSTGSASSERELAANYLRPALRDYLRLRSASPLYPQCHARLAGSREHLVRADAAAEYLARATRLRPTEGGLWHLAGLERVHSGDFDRAWLFWKRSLLCSPDHLPYILPIALQRLGPAQTLDLVLPDVPVLLLKAARTPPLSDNRETRRDFARRAAASLAAHGLTTRDDLYARAWLLRESGDAAAAAVAYEAALLKAPGATDWRFELAELLLERGELAEAEAQVRRVLAERPGMEGARDLNAAVVRARSGGR